MSWLYFIALEILRNYTLIQWLKLRPHYGWCIIIRFFAGIFFWFYHFPDPATTPFPALVYACFQVSSFYIAFDMILNKLRGKAWNYQGENSGAYFDEQKKARYYLLKAGSLVILILSLIVMYGKI